MFAFALYGWHGSIENMDEAIDTIKEAQSIADDAIDLAEKRTIELIECQGDTLI